MIITLKGADFSASKIGTLDTWSIFTTLGGGTTYTGAKMVKRGASYSATVTLAEDYEVSSAGVKVTMGGTDVTSTAVTTNGSTITISIASVTGTVYISVPTKNTATGEEGGNTPPATDEIIDFTTVAGAYIVANGGTKDSANWNTTDYIAVYPNSKYTYYGNTALGDIYIPAVYAYDSNKNPIQAFMTSVDGTNGYVFKTTNDTAYIKLCSHKDTALKLEYSPNAIGGLAIAYVEGGYVSKTGEIATPSGTASKNWTRTEYIDVSEIRSIEYVGTVPEGGLETVAAVYGYDSNRTPIEMVLAPSTTEHVNGYIVTLTNASIKYIVACGYTKNGEAFSVTSGGSGSENRLTFSPDVIEIPGYAEAGTGAYNIAAEFLDVPDEEYNVIKLTANAGQTIKYVEFSIDGTYYSQDGLIRADPDDGGSFNITNLSGATTILYSIYADDVSTVTFELNRDVTIRSITVWK